MLPREIRFNSEFLKGTDTVLFWKNTRHINRGIYETILKIVPRHAYNAVFHNKRVIFDETDIISFICRKRLMGYWGRNDICEQLFQQGGPFFFVTTENLPWLLFTDVQGFKDGTNMMAVASVGLEIRILMEVEMNNHLHALLEGVYEEVFQFVMRFRKMMSRYQVGRGNPSLANWDIQIKPIPDLRSLRKALLYIARNPSVAGRNVTPWGYRWSSTHLLFNDLLPQFAQGVPFNELKYKEKRAVVHARELCLPDTFRILDGMVLRQSFVDYKRAESFFESAHQFFHLIARKIESDAETARWIGESILLPNEDVFRIVSDWYRVKSTQSLLPEQRLEAARRMKAELMSNNKQVAQVLRLPLEQVNQLFPVPQ